ncbi:MAG: ATP-binding cassette domain-containing protein, partial [Planctomycetota bacterium]
RERASLLLDSVGLFEKQRRPVPQLSHGERQRVAICRALLLNPKVVLADEPTGNLDPENAERIVQLLIRETSQADSQLIMVTHDHSLLKHFHRVVCFDQFRRRILVETGGGTGADAAGVAT